MNPDLTNSAWPDSLWLATAAEAPVFSSLVGPAETDTVVVGAGYTGLSTALHLATQGRPVVVLDRNQPGWGCSGRNGGQVNPALKLGGDDMRSRYGSNAEQVAGLYASACDLVFELVEQHRLRCHAIRPGYLQGMRTGRERRFAIQWRSYWSRDSEVALLDRAEIADLLGADYYHSGLLDPRGGSLQPLSYARELARVCTELGCIVYGETPALSVQRSGAQWLVITPQGRLRCRHLVLATNGYTDNLWPGLRRSLVPVASLISASEPMPDAMAEAILPGRHAVAEIGGVPHYYRVDENNRLVFGGKATLIGTLGNLDTRKLRGTATRIFPSIRSVEWQYDWGGYVAMSADGTPHLLRLDQDVYAGCAYNGRGVAMATLVGREIACLIETGSNRLPVYPLKEIPLHELYPVGIASRMLFGYARDMLGKLQRNGMAG